MAGLDAGLVAVESHQLDRLDLMGCGVADHFGGVGVQQDADVRGLVQLFPVDLAEPCRGGDLPEVEVQP